MAWFCENASWLTGIPLWLHAQLLASLNAVDKLIGQGFKPERTIILSFGFDEELGGFQVSVIHPAREVLTSYRALPTMEING